MYESPLTLNEWKIEANSLDQAIKDTAESVGEKFDRYVLHVISETGITVDRDELIKALRYDRDQYNKGYHDGMKRGIEIGSPTRGHWISTKEAEDMGDIMKEFTCSVCGCCEWDCTESESFNFCPNCGADMRGE